MKNCKNINIGYELWKQGYALKDCSPSGEMKAYKLWKELYESGTVNTAYEFIQHLLVAEPEMLYDQAAEEKRYREENEPKIREYFAEHFEGKEWNDIDPEEWDWYSDWHKDVFGYRPHGIVCGEYINPHA